MTSPRVNVKKVGDWEKASRTMPQLRPAYVEAEDKAVNQEALLFQRKVGQAFKSSGASNGKAWPPNSDSTRARKGSSKPLINTGDLRGSVNVQKVGRAKYFVGVPSNARSKKGGQLIRIGEVHEYGKVIAFKVTKKQHRYVMAMMSKFGGLGGSKSSPNSGAAFRPGAVFVIKIPARSFLQSTMDAHFKPIQSNKRIKNRIARQMRAKFGNLIQVR